jgi:hypothetical protein
VAAACHDDSRGEPAWPLIVAQHVGALLTHIDRRDLDGLTPGEVQSRTYAKLFRADNLPSREGLSYLRESVPGLVESLVVDFPDALSWLRDSEVERFGGLTVLHEAGLANLRPSSRTARAYSHSRWREFRDTTGWVGLHSQPRAGHAAPADAGIGPVDASYGVLAAMAAGIRSRYM